MNEMHGSKLIGIATAHKENLKNTTGMQSRDARAGAPFFKEEIAPLQKDLNE